MMRSGRQGMRQASWTPAIVLRLKMAVFFLLNVYDKAGL